MPGSAACRIYLNLSFTPIYSIISGFFKIQVVDSYTIVLKIH